MGSGCSSPLRRLGGRRGKPSRRESSPFEGLNGGDAGDGSDSKHHSQPQTSVHQKYARDNEITIQSEANEDHPSSASYYTDGKNHNEETKVSDHSGNLDSKTAVGITNSSSNFASGGSSGAVARMIGLNGTYVPHDRHLLVSPALSPAPSTCYSPSPASSTPPGCTSSIDLNDLNEAFKMLTFGSPDDYVNNDKRRIKHPERPQLTELQNYYTQQLVQTQNDLINSISVIFITTDSFQFNTATNTITSSSTGQESEKPPTTSLQSFITNPNIETLSNHIESILKSFCDEHLFNLRFFNLSYAHLSEHFHINNLIDASLKIFEQEYHDNGQRTVAIVLSNVGSNSFGSGSTESSTSPSSGAKPLHQPSSDKKLLPTKIEVKDMDKLQNLNLSVKAKELVKKWYNQVESTFYLNPIYLIYPKILSESAEERDQAWQNWLSDSAEMITSIELVLATDPDLTFKFKLESLFDSHMEFIKKNSTLQKRTLLIRLNYPQPMNSGSSNQQQQQSSSFQQKHSILSELARLLVDPNKMNLKKCMSNDEFIKKVCDWINENFAKFIESIEENKVTHGKHVPPFIERNLFTELTCQRTRLEYYLDNITETYETKCRSFYDTQISPMLNCVVNSPNNNMGLTPSDDQQSSELSVSSNHLVFISGPKGCGKSTLFAQLVRLTAQDQFNKTQIIYRFCGITLDSLKPNRLLRSICEQFCQTQGENITAASYIYSSRGEIMSALNKIIKQQPSLIFLDGLDSFQESGVELDLNWLCEIKSNLPIRIFIMLETDSALYKRFLGSYSDATHISLDNPSLGEWAQMLSTTSRSRRFKSVGNLYDEIKKYRDKESKDSKFTYTEAIDIIHLCRIRQLNNESIFLELSPNVMQNSLTQSLKNAQQVAITHLQYLLTPYQLGALFVSFESSRNGLSESDIISIMTMISQASKVSPSNNELKFSFALFNYVKIQLQPWLLSIICDTSVKLSIQKGFLLKAIEHYATNLYPSIVSEVRDNLLDYFNGQIKSKPSRSNTCKGDNSNSDPKENVSPSESLWLATKASEVENLLILMNPSKARDHIMNKNQFFQQFLHGSMPEEFIEDCERIKDLLSKKPSANDELQSLVNYIKQSIYPLRYEGSQIYSQIYCRAYETIKSGKLSKSKKLNEILTCAACPPIRNLLPISEASVNSFIKTRIGQNQTPSTQSTGSSLSAQSANNQKTTRSSTYSTSQSFGQMQLKQKIYTIKGNHRHVIAIYPDKSSIAVWDIYEEKAVRTINNLDQPRDLRMIDQKRAVVLCNRELRVYDLDTGAFLTKLPGILNHKMPFFEVFEDNYVVALARNRMYVNMFNLNNGELETTFKVGEDRFLNSLLVSANGGICVCGDETQKPFPLLVWNLNERRLLYDLRLDRHEFITRMSAISDDGHFVVSVCRQLGDSDPPYGTPNSVNNSNNSSGQHKSCPNFIVIYDLSSGTLFKKWKPGLDSCGVAISLSADRSGKVINTIVDSSILVWDLSTGSKRHTLIGHRAPADVIRVQNNRLFSMDSTCRDQSLRIWDIEEGYCLAVFSPDAPVNCCQISTRGDALVCGFAAETRLSTLVMCKNEVVNDVLKRNKRRKSSKSLYIFDEPPSRKSSS